MTTEIATGFDLLRDAYVAEIASQVRLYRHTRTGAEILSIENDDENKVFGIAFRTPPTDSTGIAHILEHSVLCGSRKYPLKEPFVELIKGSLNTFLNAFTYPDKTCYPVASQNTQDLYNMIDVYLDAVFFPRLTPHVLEQEGWHYELENPDDPLIFKGVVFNEMKGAFGAPERALNSYAQRSLFPDTTYGVESGGLPAHIPDLTFEQFSAFHRTHYHPSNARIFFYGDDDPQRRLEIIAAYLDEFEPITPDSEIALQPPFDAPRTLTYPYSVDADEDLSKKSMVSVNWALPTTNDAELVLALEILDQILLGTPANPLYKALLDSGLGEDLTHSGFDEDLRQGMFSVGMKGIASDDVGKVEQLILATLTQLAEQGIDRNTIEAAVNTVEFQLRERNTGSFPRGLAVMIRSLTTWLHGDDPLAPLAFEQPLAAIKQHLASGTPFFETLIRDLLLNNQHRTTVILQPDPDHARREAEAEQQRLAAVRATLSDADVQAIIANTRTLKQMQETPDPPEAIALIPALKLADLDRHERPIPTEQLEQLGTPVLYHELATSGIGYVDLAFDLHCLPQELVPYCGLIGRILLETGTAKEDFVSLSQRIGRTTGGIGAQAWSSAIANAERGATRLMVRGKATRDNMGELFSIMRDVLLTARLDNRERIRQLVLEEKAQLEAALAPAGHRFVGAYLAGLFNEAGWATEQMSGIGYLFFLRQLAQQVDNDWDGVYARLVDLRERIIRRPNVIVNITSDRATWQQLGPQLEQFLAALPATEAEPQVWQPTYAQPFVGLSMPSQVNYVGKAANLYRLGYTLHGSAMVILKYLNTTWMWDQVRVKGGAYGGFARFNRHSGVFDFLSYRDPNLLGTLAVYDKTADFLRSVELTEQDVTRSIIGTIGDIDTYRLPDARGYTALTRYLIGDDANTRQALREQVLDTTIADFRAFAEVLEQVRTQGIVAVLGSTEQIAAANAQQPNLLTRVKVL